MEWRRNGGSENELRIAYARANKIYTNARIASGKTAEDIFLQNMSVIIMEAIDCIETDSPLQPHNFDKLRYAFSSCPSSYLLSLGNSLAIVLEKLLMDRCYRPNESWQSGVSSSFMYVDDQNSEGNDQMECEIKTEDDDFDEKPSTSGTLHEGNNDVLFENVDSNINNESDVKVEPVEAEIKQEPIEDIFLPHSGTSRPVEHASTSTVVVPKTPGSKAVTRICYWCDLPTDRYHVIPKESIARDAMLRRVTQITSVNIDKLIELKKSKTAAYFCIDHISHLTPKQDPVDLEELKVILSEPSPKAKPKPNSVIHRVVAVGKTPAANQQMSKKVYETIACRLCGALSNKHNNTVSPADHMAATIFFDRLINLTQQQKESCKWFLENGIRADICKKHIRMHKNVITSMFGNSRRGPSIPQPKPPGVLLKRRWEDIQDKQAGGPSRVVATPNIVRSVAVKPPVRSQPVGGAKKVIADTAPANQRIRKIRPSSTIVGDILFVDGKPLERPVQVQFSTS
ncbi:hypothetical protein PMAYCL1PPCAC_04706 [Pristionchus mayeri]|uniref:Uncharacterized protein n=1 Tax=Pristionchus mayeri TaxID=1317129 RepID=A0AAN4Z8R5_9BILA|nr:hypothetical protein PMAYCL1PPCAC_04706 [Pristionchus mayeri]